MMGAAIVTLDKAAVCLDGVGRDRLFCANWRTCSLEDMGVEVFQPRGGMPTPWFLVARDAREGIVLALPLTNVLGFAPADAAPKGIHDLCPPAEGP